MLFVIRDTGHKAIYVYLKKLTTLFCNILYESELINRLIPYFVNADVIDVQANLLVCYIYPFGIILVQIPKLTFINIAMQNQVIV
jgi:hypothetical protein